MDLLEAKQFVVHFVTGDYTPEGYATFLQWLRYATVAEMNAIADDYEALHESWPFAEDEPSPLWVAELEGKLDNIGDDVDGDVEAVPVPTGGRFTRRRIWVAAASVIVVLSAAGLWYTTQYTPGHKGSTINSQRKEPSLSQIIRTPRGIVQKQLILADGSRVWLNAASTLKYPLAFSGPERIVELSGEAYFEVAKNSAMPFRVRIKDAEVEVLGTHFDIMAYENDKVSKTTVIDGGVRLEGRISQKSLEPGEQGVIAYPASNDKGGNDKGGNDKLVEQIQVIKIADPNFVIAWREGVLQFESADLSTVLHAVERYYDVDIQFDQGMSEKVFTGGFTKQDKLEHVLKMLTSFYRLQYKMNGKTVTVLH